MSSPATAPFNLFVPDDFIELPSGEASFEELQELSGQLATHFGVDDDLNDKGVAETVAMLAAVGAAASAGGSAFTAAAIFRSPSVEDRPLMILLNCFTVASQDQDPRATLAELTTAQTATPAQLAGGSAVVVEQSAASQVRAGEETVTITTHQLTAWIPGPDQLAAVSVSSNNTEDWDHIVDFAHGLFDTFEWLEE